MGKWLWPWHDEDKPEGPEIGEFWVADQVAEAAQVSRTTVLNWHSDGRLLPTAFAGKRRIRLYDPTLVREFLAATGRTPRRRQTL